MALNKLQQKVFDRVVHEKQPITFLTSQPGAGKSFTTAAIAKAVNGSKLTATSHKAKAVISEMSGIEATTIHKYMKYTLVNHNYTQKLTKYSEDIEPCSLLIVDEVSMLPNVILTDILHEVNSPNGAFSQVLFVGDAIQLPAVSNPPNLKKLEQYKVELTEQMRQEHCIDLANYFTSYRQAISNNTMPASLLVNSPLITIHDDHKEFCREYLKCDGNKRIIVYRNKVAEKYSQYIHEGDTFNVGDRVILDKPIQSIGAYNKDIVTITAVDADYNEHFLNITVTSDTGGRATVRHYHSTGELNRQLELLKSQDNEPAYWELFDQSFRLKHVYASTVHAVQGDSIDTVFLDAYDIVSAHQAAKTRYNNPISQDMMLRLLYVAISRMKSHCHIYTGAKPRNYEELTKDPDRKIRVVKQKEKPKEQAKFKL